MDEPIPRDDGTPPLSSDLPEPGPSRFRVLVVDDNEIAAQCLASILRLEGYEVRVAYDGEAALEDVRAFRPVVVLSDLGLPGIDGFEVARRIRGDRELSAGLRLLATLTGQGGTDARRRSRDAGFDRHLVKPVDPEAVLDLLALIE